MESIGVHTKSGREIFAQENNYFCLIDGKHTPLANLSNEQLSEFQELKNVKAQQAEAAARLAQEEADRAAAVVTEPEPEKQVEEILDCKAPDMEAVDMAECGVSGTNSHSDPDGEMSVDGVSEDNKPYTIPETE